MSDAAVMVVVNGIIILAGMVIGYLKLKNGIEQKIDNNTVITQQGAAAAATQARTAAVNATEAKAVAQSIDKKLNGGIDSAINTAMESVKLLVLDHAASDERNMEEINKKFVVLTEYVHARNHDILDSMNQQSLKLEVLVKTICNHGTKL